MILLALAGVIAQRGTGFAHTYFEPTKGRWRVTEAECDRFDSKSGNCRFFPLLTSTARRFLARLETPTSYPGKTSIGRKRLRKRTFTVSSANE